MTLPASGAISMSQVNTELGRSTTAALSFDDSAFRNLAGVASGAISFSQLYGKSSYTPMTVTGHSYTAANQSSSSSGGTAYAYPSVTVSGGSGGYTYSWSITSSTNLPSLSNSTSSTATVSKTFAKNASGDFDAFLQCVVTDSTGHTVTVSGIEAYASWGTAI